MKCQTIADLDHLKDELQDRYGRLPENEIKVFDYIYKEIERNY